MQSDRFPRPVRFLTGLEHSLVRAWLARLGLRAHDDVPLPRGEDDLGDPRCFVDAMHARRDRRFLGIRPRRSMWGRSEHAIANAVARLCLHDVEASEAHWRPHRRDPVREVELRSRSESSSLFMATAMSQITSRLSL